MIKTEKMQEKVVLVGVETFDNHQTFEASMTELASLAATAGAVVTTIFTQKKERLDGKYLVGIGKLQEIKDNLEADEADMVIFNEKLTPRQNVNLEGFLGVKVIDRMQLILDIFALRARSHVGMLQVELAQLKYLLPRLSGSKGLELSRQAGGIGSRGAGESQLETDRRHIRHRLEIIEAQLKKAEKVQENSRQKRNQSNVFKLGLIGYTNAGKSSVFNALTQKIQYEQDELFATLDATTKDFSLQDEFTVTLTDTVGFIQDLPTELVQAFKSTLEESKNVDLLLHVIDASDANHKIHEDVVESIMKDLEMSDIPVLTVYNKLDLADDFAPTILPNVQISIKSEAGVQQLRQAIIAKIKELFVPFELTLPYEAAYQLPILRKIALIDTVVAEDETETYYVSGSISEREKWRLTEDGLC
ncbi:GTPase HflX [Lactococcus chungangensis]|uniref:GTPase HflX n=2 Tax=Pseudolactococcus chungangensis CAU 28 = DSM 22330 TaxID=1122154 RepID=A0A1K2HBE2_9LACT|nr:GTPase HflX [Lactococcus chungangensis]MDD3016107.1 GTPase HflX [Lactococcus chungangensis]SFZ74075.1 GTP-binding protein HflX [Lactococcus chungangensis CAU 28 = DSM 22330]